MLIHAKKAAVRRKAKRKSQRAVNGIRRAHRAMIAVTLVSQAAANHLAAVILHLHQVKIIKRKMFGDFFVLSKDYASKSTKDSSKTHRKRIEIIGKNPTIFMKNIEKTSKMSKNTITNTFGKSH